MNTEQQEDSNRGYMLMHDTIDRVEDNDHMVDVTIHCAHEHVTARAAGIDALAHEVAGVAELQESMTLLVNEQGAALDSLESVVDDTDEAISHGTLDLYESHRSQSKSKRRTMRTWTTLSLAAVGAASGGVGFGVWLGAVAIAPAVVGGGAVGGVLGFHFGR
jgi:hypothetical protein